MTKLDLLTKFNRCLCIQLIEKNPYEALQMYRQYISYLKAYDSDESYKKELQTTRNAFLEKLLKFVTDKNNANKTEDLITAYQGLLAEFTDSYKLFYDCSKLCKKLKQYDIELELLLNAEKCAPEDLDIKEALFECYKEKGLLETALKYAEELVKQDEEDPYYKFLLSQAYDLLYERTNNESYLTNAIVYAELAYKADNKTKLYLRALAILYTKAKDEEKIENIWKEILKFPNLNSDDMFVYAAHLIRHGDFKKGFEVYESRFDSSFFNDTLITEVPKYDGKKDISKKTLLVQAEQGMGDVFLFSRFLNFLKGKAEKMIVRVPNNTLAIIKRSFPFCEVMSNNKEVQADCYVSFMSCINLFGITKDTIPIRKDYLISNKEKNERFKKELFNNDKFKIGIAYEGSKGGLHSRDIPLKEFVPLTKLKNVEVYSLQYGEEDSVFEGTGIINLAGKIRTFDDTASLIENMDLMICGDNVTLNLAGGLGKKTFGVFNYLPEFRWFDLTGDDVKWFETVKPYQAKKSGEWAPVIERIAKDIEAML